MYQTGVGKPPCENENGDGKRELERGACSERPHKETEFTISELFLNEHTFYGKT